MNEPPEITPQEQTAPSCAELDAQAIEAVLRDEMQVVEEPPGPMRAVNLAGRNKLRVIFTNGTERRVLLSMFTSNDGIHAYAGGKSKLHSSYHVDGRRHIAGSIEEDEWGRRYDPPTMIRKCVPMAQLVDTEDLHFMALRNEAHYFTPESPFPLLDKKPTVLWEVDARSLVPVAVYHLHVGVVGSGGRDAIGRALDRLTESGAWVVRQVEFYNQLFPSPYLIVLQAMDDKATGVGVMPSPGFATAADSAELKDGLPFNIYFKKGTLGKVSRMPEGAEELWPPVPWCTERLTWEIEHSPFAPPLTQAGDFFFGLLRLDAKRPELIDLVVNPRWGYINAPNGSVLHRSPGHPTAPMKVLRFNCGHVSLATGTYEHADKVYYVRCRGTSTRGNGKWQTVTYRFEMEWRGV